MVPQPQLPGPAVAGPDLGPAEGDGVAGVVVGHIARVEDDLQVIADISLQPDWLGELERLSVRDVVRGADPPASLRYCRHLSLEKIIKI